MYGDNVELSTHHRKVPSSASRVRAPPAITYLGVLAAIAVYLL